MSLGLCSLKWDTIAYKAAYHHSVYLDRVNTNLDSIYIMGHSEDSAIFNSPSDRYRYYGGRVCGVSECALLNQFGVRDDDSLALDKIAQSMVDVWKKSKKHNDIMIKPTLTSGAISCFGNRVSRCQFQGRRIHSYFATFVFLSPMVVTIKN